MRAVESDRPLAAEAVAGQSVLPGTRRNADEAGTGVDTLSPPKPAGFTRRELDCRGRVIRSARVTAD